MADKKKEMMRIALPPMQEDGCWWYRVKNFARIANENGLASVEAIDLKRDDATIEKMLDVCDVLLYRFSTEQIVHLIKRFKEKHPNKPVILDTDDDMFNLSPINEGYSRFGTQEVNLKDGKPLWEHGKAEFDLYENRKRIIDYEYCLDQSDLVLTTTLRLANVLKEHNKAVAVVPNCIDFDYWPLLEAKKEKGRVDMVWSGGASHYEDLYFIKDALKTLMERFPQLHFHIAGQVFGGIRKGLPESRVHVWPWIRADGHGYRMACVKADIAIAPLLDTNFNHNKSCIKWYEYSALKVPSVLSNIPPYSDEVKDGINGLLFDGAKEFIEKVSFLVGDSLKRREMAENAYNWVKSNRDVRVVIFDWIEVIKNTTEAKNAKD